MKNTKWSRQKLLEPYRQARPLVQEASEMPFVEVILMEFTYDDIVKFMGKYFKNFIKYGHDPKA